MGCDIIDLSLEDNEKHTMQRVSFRNNPKVEVHSDNDDNSVDMLAVYGNTHEPPKKRHKTLEASRRNSDGVLTVLISPNKKRNPFGVVKESSVFTSPTKLTRTNNSFLKQCSPVKRVTANAKCTLNFGKYKINRTVLDNKQEVLSRFFIANHKVVADNEQKLNDCKGVDTECVGKRVSDIAEKYNRSLLASSSIYSVDSENSSSQSEETAKINDDFELDNSPNDAPPEAYNGQTSATMMSKSVIDLLTTSKEVNSNKLLIKIQFIFNMFVEDIEVPATWFIQIRKAINQKQLSKSTKHVRF